MTYDEAMAEAQAAYPGCYVLVNDAGDDAWDVIVWRSEDDATNDDGANAIARYAR